MVSVLSCMYLCTYLSLYFIIYLSVSLSVCLSVSVSVSFLLSENLSIRQSTCLSIYPSIHNLSTSVSLCIYLSVCMYLPVCICLYVYPSFYLSLPVHQYVYLPLSVDICCLLPTSISFYLSLHQPSYPENCILYPNTCPSLLPTTGRRVKQAEMSAENMLSYDCIPFFSSFCLNNASISSGHSGNTRTDSALRSNDAIWIL